MVQDLRVADIAGMKDVLNSPEDFSDLGAQQSMGIGNDTNGDHGEIVRISSKIAIFIDAARG